MFLVVTGVDFGRSWKYFVSMTCLKGTLYLLMCAMISFEVIGGGDTTGGFTHMLPVEVMLVWELVELAGGIVSVANSVTKVIAPTARIRAITMRV